MSKRMKKSTVMAPTSFVNLLGKTDSAEALSVFGEVPDWIEVEVLDSLLTGEQEVDDDEEDYYEEDGGNDDEEDGDEDEDDEEDDDD